jgi:hypothetical protein
LHPIGQFIVDVIGGDHRAFTFRPGKILDAEEDSPLASPEFVEEIGIHSKASVASSSEDLFQYPIFQNLRRFSSLF